MTTDYAMPDFRKDAFDCPHCGAYAHQTWDNLFRRTIQGSFHTDIWRAVCARCTEITLWYQERQVWPNTSAAPRPNEDLGNEIIDIYNEARNVASLSPRSAAALLRLCTEMLVRRLCRDEGISYGKDLFTGTTGLAKRGLSQTIQQALDILRVVGNEAVHPGQIVFDDNDNNETVSSLFSLVNLIANERITQPREIADFHSRLPATKLQEIEARDVGEP